jgi:hypothetical protein
VESKRSMGRGKKGIGEQIKEVECRSKEVDRESNVKKRIGDKKK